VRAHVTNCKPMHDARIAADDTGALYVKLITINEEFFKCSLAAPLDKPKSNDQDFEVSATVQSAKNSWWFCSCWLLSSFAVLWKMAALASHLAPRTSSIGLLGIQAPERRGVRSRLEVRACCWRGSSLVLANPRSLSCLTLTLDLGLDFESRVSSAHEQLAS